MESEALDSKIAETEQKITAVEADIKKAGEQALEANTRGDFADRDYWREEKKQLRIKEKLLREEKKQLRDEKARKEALQGLTLREVVEHPIPMLEKRLSPRRSHSKTRARWPRTFSKIVPWDDFVTGARQLYSSLDSTARIYDPPSVRIRRNAANSRRSAADESEVRGRVISLSDSVNDIAEELEIAAECTGGGSGRSASFTDLVVRPAGAQTDPDDLSAIILATGEIKAEWQFSLERGERLEDALHDPKRIGAIVQAVQQVYGDAVMDEAPLLILSNYHVTVFLKRSEDVQDKRLWASEPVWYDQTDPPARACWVYALQQAVELRDLKRKLPRAVVRPTTDGYHIQPHPQQAHLQRLEAVAQRGADGSDSWDRRLRQRTTHMSLRLQARSATGKGYVVDNQSSPALQPAAASLTDPEAEETLTLSELGLTSELLGAGQYGHTLKGFCKGELAAVKVYDLQQTGAAPAYGNEKLAYGKLADLQGITIPRLLRCGVLQHTAAPVIVTSLEGKALAEDKRVPQRLHKPMREALQALHAAGAAHGDVRCSNFLVSGREVRLVDLGQTVMQASQAQMNADVQRLKALLPYWGPKQTSQKYNSGVELVWDSWLGRAGGMRAFAGLA